jgi:F-type H+-transporting ATPase subunit b
MFFVTPAYAEEAPAGTAETGAVTGTDAHAAPAAGEVHTETGVPAEHHGGVFPPFDTSTYASQLLWLAISFVVFFVLMQKVIAPRIGGILEQRHTRIAQDLDEAARLKAQADADVAAYEAELQKPAPSRMQSAPPPATPPSSRLKPIAVPSKQTWLKS